MTVDVNKIKCNFVNEVYRHVLRTKYYALDACIDKAAEAFVYYLLSVYQDCEIPHEVQCELSNLNYLDLSIDCDETLIILNCSQQAELDLSYTSSTCTNTTTLSNNIDQSYYPVIALTNDAVYQNASINLTTTSDCGENLSTVINSGSYEYDGTTQTSQEYNPHVRISHVLSSVNSIPSGYIDKLYVYTSSVNQVELNLSPLSTPYATFAGSPYTVNTNDLYFGSTQIEVALRQLLENAMYFLYGNKDVGLWKVEKLGTNLQISSAVKHNPTTVWSGLKPYNSYVKYYVNPTVKFVNTSPANTVVTAVATTMSKTVTVNTLCGNKVVFVSGIPSLNLNIFETDFNKIVLNSPLSTTSLSLVGTTQLTCGKYNLSANETILNSTVLSRVWQKNSITVGTTKDITVYSTGLYTYILTLNNNCVITGNINIT